MLQFDDVLDAIPTWATAGDQGPELEEEGKLAENLGKKGEKIMYLESASCFDDLVEIEFFGDRESPDIDMTFKKTTTGRFKKLREVRVRLQFGTDFTRERWKRLVANQLYQGAHADRWKRFWTTAK